MKRFFTLSLLTILTASLLGCGSKSSTSVDVGDTEPMVKMSASSICHKKGSTYYDKTNNFVPYDSLEECLNDGGRLPKR